MELGKPDDVDIGIELRDWSFALEEVNEMEGYLASNRKQVDREEKSWHTTFHSLQIKAKSNPIETNLSSRNSLHGKKYPVELVTVRFYSFSVTIYINIQVSHLGCVFLSVMRYL